MANLESFKIKKMNEDKHSGWLWVKVVLFKLLFNVCVLLPSYTVKQLIQEESYLCTDQ